MKLLIFSLLVLTTAAHPFPPSSSCEFTVTTPTGILTSPNYPNTYTSSSICIYRINQAEGHIINLSFSDINLGWNETDRNFTDRLTIIDGDNEVLSRIDILSGSQYFFPARTYNSSTNHLLLFLETFNNTPKSRGFHATYQAINMGCGGILRSDNGMIKHPIDNYNFVPTICNWIIQAPPSHIIVVNGTAFDIYRGDNLTFKDWKDGNFNLLAQYRNNIEAKKIVRSTGSIMYINFNKKNPGKTDSFMLNYTFVNMSNFFKAELAQISSN